MSLTSHTPPRPIEHLSEPSALTKRLIREGCRFQDPVERDKLAADVEALRVAVAPYITGSKRVAVRVVALRRLLAAYDALNASGAA